MSRITAISGSDYRLEWPTMDPSSKVSPPVQKVALSTAYYQDSLGSCQACVDPIDEISQRPVLPLPDEQETTREELTTQGNQLITQMKSNTNASEGQRLTSDIEFLRILFECLDVQKKSRETSGQMAQKEIFEHQRVSKVLNKQAHEIEDKLVTTGSVSEIAEWINYGLTGSLFLTAAWLAFTAFTGGAGAAIEAGVYAAQAVLLIAQGLNTGIKGYSDYKGNQYSSELFGIKELREKTQRGITSDLTLNKEALKQIDEYMKMRKEAQKNWQEACQIQI